MHAEADQQIHDAVALYEQGHIPEGCMLWRIVEYVRWVAMGGCTIRDVHGELIPLRFNLVQRLILAKMLGQAAAGQPIRVVILKARKTGVTTLVQTLFTRICQTCRNQVAKTIAHKADATHEIFQIARRVIRHDPIEPEEPKRTEIDFATDSTYACFTAAGEGVGAGGTPSLLHLSEVGLWPGAMTAEKADETEYSAVKSMPNVPETIIVYESTARGRNLMWDRFNAARLGKSRYRALFVAWYLDSRNAVQVIGGFERTDEERDITYRASQEGIEITDCMLAWRREEIDELGLPLFKQEFPSTPEEAVERQKGLVVPGLRECVVDKLPFNYEGVPRSDQVGGWDYGYNDPTAFLAGVVWDGCLWVFHAFRARGMLATDMAELGIVMPGHKYYCDPSALGPRKELQRACREKEIDAQFVMAPQGRGKKEIEQLEDTWERVRRFVRKGHLKIHQDAADQLLIEADNLFFHPDTGQPQKNRGDSWGHFDMLDALRYMICGVTLETGVAARRKREPSRRAQLRSWSHAGTDERQHP